MKKFPKKLHVDNKEKFPKLNYKRILAYLRRDLYEHIISKEEKDYFDIETFRKEKLISKETIEEIITDIRDELDKLGWKTQTSYGGTGLFIYADEPPVNCYPDGFE